jgi:hypothetical protein
MITTLASAGGTALIAGAMTASPAGAMPMAPAGAVPAAATAVHPAVTAQPAGHWGDARPIPGLAALNAGGGGGVEHVACPSPGFCTAAGSYIDADGHNEAFVATESNFTWGQASPVPGLAALKGTTPDGKSTPSFIQSLSCATAGGCAVGGWYVDPFGNLQPFVADSTGGTFGTANPLVKIPDTESQFIARVTALSCPEPGNCTAALSLPFSPDGVSLVPDAFTVDEVNGTWGAPQRVDGISPIATQVEPDQIFSLSCLSPRNCEAGGYFSTPAGNLHAMVVAEISGTWTQAFALPGLAAPAVIDFNPSGDSAISSVSCNASGLCALGGTYADNHGNTRSFIATKSSTGTWTTQSVPGMDDLHAAGVANVNDVSCGAPGFCALGGQFDEQFTADSTATQAYVDALTGTNWGSAQQILGINDNPFAETLAVSCGATLPCTAGGQYTDTAGHTQAWVSSQDATPGTHDFGSFVTLQQIAGNLNAGDAGISDVSCSSGTECAAGGSYTDAAGKGQGFVAEESAATATTISVTPATVNASNEASALITAKVTGLAGGTPTGTVTVLANGQATQSTACTITLSGGTGSCPLPAGSLAAGTYSLTGNYNGDSAYGGSTSASGAGSTLTVTPALAATTTTLAVSPAAATFGSEQAVTMTARVTAQSGTPAGTVTIKAGTTTVGTITLANGAGSRLLTASQLPPGSYQLVASYGGDQANSGSASAPQALTVAAEPTSTTLTLSATSVRAGHEQSERLTVAVRPAISGIPAGTVTVKAGATTVCRITLASATGSCTLTASQLAAGTYQLTVSYPGVTPYAASTSTAKTLTVRR